VPESTVAAVAAVVDEHSSIGEKVLDQRRGVLMLGAEQVARTASHRRHVDAWILSLTAQNSQPARVSKTWTQSAANGGGLHVVLVFCSLLVERAEQREEQAVQGSGHGELAGLLPALSLAVLLPRYFRSIFVVQKCI